MVDPEVHPTRVGGQIVDAIRHRPAQLLDQEVVHSDLLRIACRAIVAPAVLDVANQFLLFGIDRDGRLMLGQRRAYCGADLRELRMAVPVAVACAGLAIALQAVAHAIEQMADQRAAHRMALRLKLLCQPADALACPAQRRLRVAARRRLDQPAQIRQQRCILGCRHLAAAGAANPIWFRRVRQFLQAAPDRARCDPRGGRHRRDPAATRRPRSLRNGATAEKRCRMAATSIIHTRHSVRAARRRSAG
jgi:hypothetical protein